MRSINQSERNFQEGRITKYAFLIFVQFRGIKLQELKDDLIG